MFTISAFSPILCSFDSSGVKSDKVSHAGFLSPVGVMRQLFLDASPLTWTPQLSRKCGACSAYLHTFSFPSSEYGWSGFKPESASSGFSTAVPSGSLPSRSNEPEEKWIALCPADTMAHFFPAFCSLIPQRRPESPPPIITVSNFMACSAICYHLYMVPALRVRILPNISIVNIRFHAVCRSSIQDTFLSTSRSQNS